MKRRQFLEALGGPTLGIYAHGAPLKITGIRTHKFLIGSRDFLLLEVETGGGIVGYGEASLPGRAAIVEEAVRWLERYLIGQDPAGIDDHWNRMYYQYSRWRDGSVLMTALAGIDIALWDIAGKRLGVPCWQLAGAGAAKPMRVYYSHWSQDLKDRSEQALGELTVETRAQGWRAVKWICARGGTEVERRARLVRGGGSQSRRAGLRNRTRNV